MTNTSKTSFKAAGGSRPIEEILKELFSFHRFGMKPGLENIAHLCAYWDNPQKHLRCIHIAGTNGKGSTSTLLSAILSEAQYKTGLFTSPHIRRFNERIRIGKEEIADSDIARLAEEILPEAKRIKATFFEITTAMAFRYFYEQEVDIVVLETGMGGRLDSTNIIEPEISVITAIDYDHTTYLGDTLEKIAGEKAGIIKRKKPVLIAEGRSSLKAVFWEKAAEMEAKIAFLDDFFSPSGIIYSRPLAMTAAYKRPGLTDLTLTSPIAGEHQSRNIATALGTLTLLKGSFPVSNEHIRQGVAAVREYGLRGRIELLQEEPPLILDVAHNPAGIKMCAKTLLRCGYPKGWNVVFGAMDDKDIYAMLQALTTLSPTIFAVAPKVERAAPPEKIVALAQKLSLPATAFPNVAVALHKAKTAHLPLLVIGSFYLADEATAAMGQGC